VYEREREREKERGSIMRSVRAFNRRIFFGRPLNVSTFSAVKSSGNTTLENCKEILKRKRK
jgi:hypothetical protein